MSWFEALVLGIVQGLTEYLPVSSSGHLAIGSALFGIQGEENLAFTIVAMWRLYLVRWLSCGKRSNGYSPVCLSSR